MPFGPASHLSLPIGATGRGFASESIAAFAAMSSEPDTARKVLLNDLIVGLKADGVWAKLDWLSLAAAHDAQAGRLNLVTPAQAMTAVSAPTFVTDRGYSGDGAASYLDTGWNPTTASSPKFTQNGGTMAVWVGTNVLGLTMFDIGMSARSQINTKSAASQALQTPNQAGTGPWTLPADTSIGMLGWTRTASSATAGYKNGAQIGSGASASSAPINGNFFVGATNNSAAIGTPTQFSTRRIQAVAWGGTFTTGNHLALYTRLNTYFTAIGAV